MARNFGDDLYNFEDMTDDEVRAVVLEQLQEQPNLVADEIDVSVREGAVTISGRVGTDAEVRVAEAVLDDVLGLDNFSNELMVDELRRGEMPMDTAPGERGSRMGEQGREASDQYTDTADHLIDDLDSDMNGTPDIGHAIRDASPYTPPDRPGSDGYGSREDH
jgi:hypothetical protein